MWQALTAWLWMMFWVLVVAGGFNLVVIAIFILSGSGSKENDRP